MEQTLALSVWGKESQHSGFLASHLRGHPIIFQKLPGDSVCRAPSLHNLC